VSVMVANSWLSRSIRHCPSNTGDELQGPRPHLAGARTLSASSPCSTASGRWKVESSGEKPSEMLAIARTWMTLMAGLTRARPRSSDLARLRQLQLLGRRPHPSAISPSDNLVNRSSDSCQPRQHVSNGIGSGMPFCTMLSAVPQKSSLIDTVVSMTPGIFGSSNLSPCRMRLVHL
jgi:hypothetical protein